MGQAGVDQASLLLKPAGIFFAHGCHPVKSRYSSLQWNTSYLAGTVPYRPLLALLPLAPVFSSLPVKDMGSPSSLALLLELLPGNCPQ